MPFCTRDLPGSVMLPDPPAPVSRVTPSEAAPEEPFAQVAWIVTVPLSLTKMSLPSITAVLPLNDVA